MKSECPSSLYGARFACECGKEHAITPRSVVYQTGALEQLPAAAATCAAGREAAVLFDARTREVAGAQAAEVLRHCGWQVREILVEDLPDGGSPVCDDWTHDRLLPGLDGVDLVVPVGSGVMNDLGKWLAFDLGVPFITVATAASMNGYTSANVAPTLKGVKSLQLARPAEVVLADPQVLRNAPWEMTAAGLGDVLAKSVSSADWYANHVLFGDYYCERAVGLITELEPLYLENPHALADRDPKAFDALVEALLLTGVAMTMAEDSAPASGGEHMVSHTLDMMAAKDGVKHDLHGRQVGVGTVLASEIYLRLLELESPDWREEPAVIDRAFWGSMADAVEKAYAPKRKRLTEARRVLSQGDQWDRLRETLSAMVRSPGRIHGCLKAAGAACSAANIGITPARLNEALSHAHEIRSRFTILDLARLAGLLPEGTGELIEQWG